MYDVIVVGARCAGSPLALRLARAGHRILLVDRATFPSDTMSTHFIQLPGMARLRHWGVLDDVLATGCPLINQAKIDTAGEVGEFEIPLVEGVPGLISPRRTILDKVLVDAAVGAGAELREGVQIDSLIFDGDRVVGVEGHTSEGSFSERARFVVGADGKHSVVAAGVDAPRPHDYGDLTSGYYSYFDGLECPATEIFFYDGLCVVMFPTHDDLVVVAVVWDNALFKERKRDIEGSFFNALGEIPGLAERVHAGKREERFIGSADVPNFIRKASGTGWALVGDAYNHKDPIPADGISDAFRTADYLADALNEILAEGADETAALTEYERRSGEVAVPFLEKAVTTARLELPPNERSGAFFDIRLSQHDEAESLVAAAPA